MSARKLSALEPLKRMKLKHVLTYIFFTRPDLNTIFTDSRNYWHDTIRLFESTPIRFVVGRKTTIGKRPRPRKYSKCSTRKYYLFRLTRIVFYVTNFFFFFLHSRALIVDFLRRRYRSFRGFMIRVYSIQ